MQRYYMGTRTAALSVILALSALGCATMGSGPAPLQLGPDGKAGYINVHGEMLRSYGGVDGPYGGSIEWGSFQNKYIGVGTSIGYSSVGAGTGMPRELFFGGGPQFHIPIGRHLLVLPSVNLGYRLADAPGGIGGGLAMYLSLGVAYKLNSVYFGLEAQRPLFLQLPNVDSAFFPNLTTAGAFVGFYY
jgi:hypothetical protein